MHVFPRIIQNKVDYTSQPIPEYWGLSEIHKIDRDLRNIETVAVPILCNAYVQLN